MSARLTLGAGLLLVSALLLPGCAGRGRDLFVREGCVNCHRFRDLGVGGAADLSNIASRLDAAAIRRQITDPAARGPASRMPPFPHLSWFDLRSLNAFFRG
jgi:cbb3-type cytochrome oxidase cytochrome c subunit